MLHPLDSIPELKTERLVLNGFVGSDLDAFAAMLADPRVGAPKGFPSGASRPQAWGGLANILGHWALRGFGLFAVRRRDTGAFIGSVGLIEPEGWPAPEATWTIAADHQGSGYAREAASAVLAHAFDTLELSLVVSFIPPENEASRRVASAIGMACSGEVTVFGETAERWVKVRGDI